LTHCADLRSPARENDACVLLRWTTVHRFVLLMPHEHRDLAALRAEAIAGVGDGSAMTLILQGELEPSGSSAFGGEFRGSFDGVPATAYVLGLVNPQGTVIMVIANNEGSPWLQLRDRNGIVENCTLQMRAGSTDLDGVQHFRATSER
jgi:hypothetical protein